MIEAYKEFWKRYVDFDGTSSRPKFWYAVLINAIISFAINSFSHISSLKIALNVVDSLWGIAVLIPSLALALRRLRDAGKNLANIFWILLPIIGWIILIVLYCQPSAPKEDKTENPQDIKDKNKNRDNCRYCGTNLTDAVDRCPSCGAKIED